MCRWAVQDDTDSWRGNQSDAQLCTLHAPRLQMSPCMTVGLRKALFSLYTLQSQACNDCKVCEGPGGVVNMTCFKQNREKGGYLNL